VGDEIPERGWLAFHIIHFSFPVACIIFRGTSLWKIRATKGMKGMSENRLAGIPIIGAVAAAVAASLCCGGPLVLIIAGASGACIASLKFLSPYRPYFIVFSLLFLGLAFYWVYGRKPVRKSGAGEYCAYPRAGRYTKTILWITTVLVVLLLLFPYILRFFKG
jgi:mercuric ion transport protein